MPLEGESAIARKLGISRETVRRYALKPDGYIPVIDKAPVETTVDEYLPHIAKMLETAEKEEIHIPTCQFSPRCSNLRKALALNSSGEILNNSGLVLNQLSIAS